MAAKKGKRRAKRAADKTEVIEFGQKVWLAGLGAFARARSEGPKLFEALVEEGSAVQDQTRDATQQAFKDAMSQMRGAADKRLATIRGKANDTWDSMEKIFQSRVHKALQQLGMPTSQEIRALTRKVDELTHGVEALSKRERRTSRAAAASASGNAGQGAAV